MDSDFPIIVIVGIVVCVVLPVVVTTVCLLCYGFKCFCFGKIDKDGKLVSADVQTYADDKPVNYKEEIEFM